MLWALKKKLFNERILLDTQNTCINCWVRIYSQRNLHTLNEKLPKKWPGKKSKKLNDKVVGSALELSAKRLSTIWIKKYVLKYCFCNLTYRKPEKIFKCINFPLIKQLIVLGNIIYGPWREKTCLWGLRTTQAQTSLSICAVWSAPLFFPFLESIISKLASSEILTFWLVSVAEQTGFNLALMETRRQVLSQWGPYVYKWHAWCEQTYY